MAGKKTVKLSVLTEFREQGGKAVTKIQNQLLESNKRLESLSGHRLFGDLGKGVRAASTELTALKEKMTFAQSRDEARQYALEIEKVHDNIKKAAALDLDDLLKAKEQHKSLINYRKELEKLKKERDRLKEPLKATETKKAAALQKGKKAGLIDTRTKSASVALSKLEAKYKAAQKKIADLKKQGRSQESKEFLGMKKRVDEYEKVKEGLKEVLELEDARAAELAASQEKVMKTQSRITELKNKGADLTTYELSELHEYERETKKILAAQTASIRVDEKAIDAKKQQLEEERKISKEKKIQNFSISGAIAKQLTYTEVLAQAKRLWHSIFATTLELDRSLTDIAVVTSMNREQAYSMLGTYQSMAREVGLTTTAVVDLSTQFFRQGKTADEALKLTKDAAVLARIANIDAVEAADYLTSALNGFNIEAERATEIVDRFANLSANSASSVDELASALQKVAPMAATAGASIDNMMAFMAKGIETTREAAENIGTAFKTIFARMSELKDLGAAAEDGMTLSRADEALSEIGVSLRDVVNGGFRPLDEVLIDVGHKWEGLDNMTKAYIGTVLAGTRQQSRLHAVMNDFPRTLELIEISQTSAGVAALQHSEYMEGLEASITNLKTAWQTLITRISSSDFIITLVKTITTTIDLMAAILGTLPGKILMVIAGFKALSIVVTGIGEKLVKMGESNTSLAAIMKPFTTDKGKLKVPDLKKLLNPQGAGEAVKALGSQIKNTFASVGASIGSAKTGMNNFFKARAAANKAYGEQVSKLRENKKKIEKTQRLIDKAEKHGLLRAKAKLEIEKKTLMVKRKQLSAERKNLKLGKQAVSGNIATAAAAAALVAAVALYVKLLNSSPVSDEAAEWKAAAQNVMDIVEAIKDFFGGIVEGIKGFISGLGIAEDAVYVLIVAVIALGVAIAIASGGLSVISGIIVSGVAGLASMLLLSKAFLSPVDKLAAKFEATYNSIKDSNEELEKTKSLLADVESKLSRLQALEGRLVLSEEEAAELEKLKKEIHAMDGYTEGQDEVSFLEGQKSTLKNNESDLKREIRQEMDEFSRAYRRGEVTKAEMFKELRDKEKSDEVEKGTYTEAMDDFIIESAMGADYDSYSKADNKVRESLAAATELNQDQILKKYRKDKADLQEKIDEEDRKTAPRSYQVGDRYKSEHYRSQEKIDAWEQQIKDLGDADALVKEATARTAKTIDAYYDGIKNLDADNPYSIANTLFGARSDSFSSYLKEMTEQEVENLKATNPEIERMLQASIALGEQFTNAQYQAYDKLLSNIDKANEGIAGVTKEGKESAMGFLSEYLTAEDLKGITDPQDMLREIRDRMLDSGQELDPIVWNAIQATIESPALEDFEATANNIVDGMTKAKKVIEGGVGGLQLAELMDLTAGLENQEEIIKKFMDGTLTEFDLYAHELEELTDLMEKTVQDFNAEYRKSDGEMSSGVMDQYKDEIRQYAATVEGLRKSMRDERIETMFDGAAEELDEFTESLEKMQQAEEFIEKLKEHAAQTTELSRIGLDTSFDSKLMQQELNKEVEKASKELRLEAQKISLEAQRDAMEEARNAALIDSQTQLNETLSQINENLENGVPFTYNGHEIELNKD